MRNALAWGLGGFAAALLLVATLRTVVAEKASAPAGCKQWEITISNPSNLVTTDTLPMVGATPAAIKGPEGGWEPFGYATTGQLAFRRCAKD